MTLQTTVVATPYFVLLHDRKPFEPEVVTLSGGEPCSIFYGFSNKAHYDPFIASCAVPLTPYPLGRIHLENVNERPGNELKLIALDAVSPEAVEVMAATNLHVLDAQLKHSSQVSAGYRMIFDQETKSYRVEQAVG